MKNIELLSPVGKKESAYAAIANGADALYLGGMKFGARAFAENFDFEELNEIIQYAHLYHVRVFVTMNTIIFEDEIEESLAYVKQLYDLCVDAIIVQDLGLLYLLRTKFPDFEVHASTQMHIYNHSALNFLKQQGVKRAVLARECSIDKIRSFKDIKIEKEVFVHGALCVSYSGQCLFSAFNNERSGNRGKCAQGCRMKYQLMQDDRKIQHDAYLISPKDLNTLDYVDELMDAGIDSFKIEGRMKSPEYVGYATYLYRSAMDKKKVESDSLNRLKVLFNRNYTSGQLFLADGTSYINHERPNHIGVTIGSVIGINKKRFQVKLEKPLNQGDGIRMIQKEDIGFVANWIYKDGLLVNSANAGDIIEFDYTHQIDVGANVVKTKDVLWEKEIRENYLNSSRKVVLSAKVVLKVNIPMKIEVWDQYGNHCEVYSEQIIQEAQTKPLMKEDIEKQLRKTKDTMYEFDTIEIEIVGSVFMPIKQVNEVRRSVLHKMSKHVLSQYRRDMNLFEIGEIRNQRIESRWNVSVLNEMQLLMCLTYAVACIYVEDESLYQRYKSDKRVKLATPNIYDRTYELSSLVGELGGLHEGVSMDYSFNISNSYAVEYANRLGIESICLSLELKNEQISSIMTALANRIQKNINIELFVYGKAKLMSSEYCVVNDCILSNNKKDCTLCKKKDYYLKDGKGNQFYLQGDSDCRMHLYHHSPINKYKKIQEYMQMGVQSFRISFVQESEEEMKEIFRKFQILTESST